MRLDRFLSECNFGSRKDVKKIITQGRVSVNGEKVTDPGAGISPEDDEIRLDDEKVSYRKYVYYMMNKPMGVITAVSDSRERTVMDLLQTPVEKGLAPVGRLDKDTEGLLILSNDGGFAHRLLAPRSGIKKTYYARIEGRKRDRMDESDVAAFEQGIELSDHRCLPAKLEIISPDEIRLTICEGKFHQVKRMCASRGFHVTYLKRESIGGLVLDESLAPGEYRKLTPEEMKIL